MSYAVVDLFRWHMRRRGAQGGMSKHRRRRVHHRCNRVARQLAVVVSHIGNAVVRRAVLRATVGRHERRRGTQNSVSEDQWRRVHRICMVVIAHHAAVGRDVL